MADTDGTKKSNQSINQIKFICDKNKHNVTHTKNKAGMSTGHKGSMKLH